MTLTSVPASASRRASCNSVIIAPVIALRFSGRLSVMRATRSWTSKRIVSVVLRNLPMDCPLTVAHSYRWFVVPLAKRHLAHLAARQPRQIHDELDALRTFVPCDQRPAMRDQRIDRDLSALLEHDNRLDRLTPTLVRNTDHRGVRHVRMSHQSLFHLAAI